MSNKLFVGNLAWSVTNDKLIEVFSAFGPVVEAKVLMDHQTGRSRGFGFVTFQNEADADRATAEMHNKEIDGRAIRCDNTQQSDRKDRPRRDNREAREGRDNREARSYGRRDDNYGHRDDNGSREDRPRRNAHHDDHSHYESRAPRTSSYDRFNYNVNDFPPDPERSSRNDRRNNRRKDRNYDDDDRW